MSCQSKQKQQQLNSLTQQWNLRLEVTAQQQKKSKRLISQQRSELVPIHIEQKSYETVQINIGSILNSQQNNLSQTQNIDDQDLEELDQIRYLQQSKLLTRRLTKLTNNGSLGQSQSLNRLITLKKLQKSSTSVDIQTSNRELQNQSQTNTLRSKQIVGDSSLKLGQSAVDQHHRSISPTKDIKNTRKLTNITGQGQSPTNRNNNNQSIENSTSLDLLNLSQLGLRQDDNSSQQSPLKALVNEQISDLTYRENYQMQPSYTYLDKLTVEQYNMTNAQIQKMFPGQVLDMTVNPSQQIENLRLGINDAMRKVHRVLSNHNPNSVTEINPKVKFMQKIRILEDENFYYKINVSEEVRPCFFQLKLDEGQCNLLVSFQTEFPSKLMNDFHLKKETNVIFPSSFRGRFMYINIQGLFDSNGIFIVKFLENKTHDNEMTKGQKMLADKKKFENLQTSIQDMIYDRNIYKEFMKKLEIIKADRKSRRRPIRCQSYDDYLDQEKDRREMALVRRDQAEEMEYQRRVNDIKRREMRLAIKLENEREIRKVQREQHKVMQWIRTVQTRKIVLQIYKIFHDKRMWTFKQINRVLMCNRLIRYFKKHLKRFGEDCKERLLYKSQQSLRLVTTTINLPLNYRAATLLQDFMQETSQRHKLKIKMLAYYNQILFVQQIWRKSLKQKIASRMQLLDLYWNRIVTELGHIHGDTQKFLKYQTKIPNDLKKKILFELVISNYHLYMRQYMQWERDLSTKSQKVIFASRIIERFTTINWTDSISKQRITLEIKAYVEKHGTGKQKKSQILRLNSLLNMNSDLGSTQSQLGFNNPLNIEQNPINSDIKYQFSSPNHQSPRKSNVTNGINSSTIVAGVLQRQSTTRGQIEIDREQAEAIENFISKQRKQAQPAPRYEFIKNVQEFIKQIREVNEKLIKEKNEKNNAIANTNGVNNIDDKQKGQQSNLKLKKIQ
eukprot:403345176